MKSLRILLSMLEPPLPFGHATGRLYYVLLKGLVERGHHVTAFATCTKPADMPAARELFPAPDFDLRTYPVPERTRGLIGKLRTLRRPYASSFSPDLRHDLQVERDRGYDILHLESLWCGWLATDFDLRTVVLDFHSLYDIDQSAQRPAGLADWCHRALRRYGEHRILRSIPRLIALTERLREGVLKIAPNATVDVIPLGIDTSLYQFIPQEERQPQPLISIIGSMNWYPSRSAAERLIRNLWPEIKRRVPEARVQIVGWGARSALSDFLATTDVEIVEDVPETRPYFRRAGVLLYAPTRGSGMKVKILESFAYGVPVVTTSEGVEGIPAEDGVHAGISDNDEGLIDRTVTLLRDVERQERQRRAARDLLVSHCGPKPVLDAMERCYGGMMSGANNVVDQASSTDCRGSKVSI